MVDATPRGPAPARRPWYRRGAVWAIAVIAWIGLGLLPVRWVDVHNEMFRHRGRVNLFDVYFGLLMWGCWDLVAWGS